jgi:dTMP kinase
MAGKFIVIEGTDGSGKGTQFKKLIERLPEGFPFSTVDFPQYGDAASYFVQEQLNGHYGTLHENIPKRASLFYALDRFDASEKRMKGWLNEGKTIIANRYVGSSMGHQGAKFDTKQERVDFFKWLYDLEYGICGIPKPDLNIILHVPAAIAQKMVDKKNKREYLEDKKRDIYEDDLSHLQKAEQVYLEIAELFPDNFTVVECVENGQLLSIDEVHEKVWVIASKTLGL